MKWYVSAFASIWELTKLHWVQMKPPTITSSTIVYSKTLKCGLRVAWWAPGTSVLDKAGALLSCFNGYSSLLGDLEAPGTRAILTVGRTLSNYLAIERRGCVVLCHSLSLVRRSSAGDLVPGITQGLLCPPAMSTALGWRSTAPCVLLAGWIMRSIHEVRVRACL